MTAWKGNFGITGCGACVVTNGTKNGLPAAYSFWVRLGCPIQLELISCREVGRGKAEDE